MKFAERLILVLAVILPLLFLSGGPYGLYGQDDKYVRLMSAKSVSLLEKDGKNYRKAEGPARFLHNDTWLICDTAWWNVDENLIIANGNVSIEQEQTELRSDRMIYRVDSSTAEFRGTLVQLSDKDGNILRTTDLDYNTKDSVAVFRFGGALRDKDGQIIESEQGTYDGKASLFTFHDRVNMFTDSAFVKTPDLWYNSKSSMVTFPDSVDVWKDEYFLSGHRGWYDRGKDIFFFRDAVHGMSPEKEMWSDTLFFYRSKNDFDMMGNVQLVDNSRKMTALAGKIYNIDSLDYLALWRNPVLMAQTKENKKKGEVIDTAYFAADTISYQMVKRCDVDPSEVAGAAKRLEDAAIDPVANIRLKAKEEAEKKIKEDIEADPNIDPAIKKKYAYLFPVDSTKLAAQSDEEDDPDALENPGGPPAPGEMPAPDGAPGEMLASGDSLSFTDSLALKDSLALRDSLARADSLKNRDTTKLGFILAVGKVKVFRKDMQALCDSLRYGEVDSIARMYKEPLIWNESGRHQYSADSIYLVTDKNGLQKAYLLSSAFIHAREGKKYYDQVKSAEMTAYFDEKTQLKRFDALGGVSALFYLQEDGTYTSVNKSESTIMSVEFEDGKLQEIRYYETPKSDVYPVPQISAVDSRLKGFNWQDKSRPASPQDLSWRVPRASQRQEYNCHEKTSFFFTEKYFPGYMSGVYRGIAIRDSLKKVEAARPATPAVPSDSVSVQLDSVAAADSSVTGALASAGAAHQALEAETTPVPTPPDSLYELPDSLAAPMDSLSIELDSLLKVELDSLDEIMLYLPDSVRYAREPELTPAQKRAAEARAKHEAWVKKREAKWAELDARDAEKKAKKQAAAQARKDRRMKKQMERLKLQKKQEDALREKYKQDILKKLQK